MTIMWIGTQKPIERKCYKFTPKKPNFRACFAHCINSLGQMQPTINNQQQASALSLIRRKKTKSCHSCLLGK
jgi:hypothetical protein